MPLGIKPPAQKNENPGFEGSSIKRERFSWMDPAVVLFSGAFFALLFHYPISCPDEGIIATAAERILRGQIPYRDFFSEIAPGSFYFQAFIFRFAGRDLICIRVTVLFLGVILTWLLYRLSRKLLHGPASVLPPLIMVGICYPYNYMLSHHWWGVLFLFLMLLCLPGCDGQEARKGTYGPSARLLGAGLCASAALLCMQSEGALAVLTVVIWLLLVEKLAVKANWRDSLRRGVGPASWFLLGVGTPMGIAISYFWAHGALGAWVFDNFTFLFTNYAPYESGPGIYSWVRFKSLFHWLVREPSVHNGFYFVGFYFFSVAGPAIGFAGAIWQLRRRRALEASRSRLLLLYLLVGFGSLISELHGPDMLHLIWASPIILILFVNSWNEASSAWGRWRRPLIALAGLSLILVVSGAYRRVAHREKWNSPVQTRRGTFYTDKESAGMYQQWINTIEQDVPPGSETFIYPREVQFYYLTATQNPTRHDVLYPDFHSPGQFAEAISALGRQKPKYIFNCMTVERYVIAKRLLDGPSGFYLRDPLEEILRSGRTPYELAATIAKMEVWTLKK
jgi:hypothetical protein